MLRKLVCLVLVFFSMSVALSKPATSAASCSCPSCDRYPYCYDNLGQYWDCEHYMSRFC